MMIDNNLDFLNDQEEQTNQEQEVEQTEQESPDEVVTEQAQKEEQQKDSKDSKQSWKELREKAEKAEKLQKERDEYYALLQQIAEQQYYQQQQLAQQKPVNTKIEDDIDIDSLSDDDLADVKLVKKIVKKIENERVREREEFEKYMKQQQQIAYESQVSSELRSRYNDFDDVVNRDNIMKLRELRPGLARTLHQIPDTKEKAIETYYAIKDLGTFETPAQRNVQARIENNSKKPRSINSVADKGSDPLNYAAFYEGGLTEDAKRAIYKDTLKKAGLD